MEIQNLNGIMVSWFSWWFLWFSLSWNCSRVWNRQIHQWYWDRRWDIGLIGLCWVYQNLCFFFWASIPTSDHLSWLNPHLWCLNFTFCTCLVLRNRILGGFKIVQSSFFADSQFTKPFFLVPDIARWCAPCASCVWSKSCGWWAPCGWRRSRRDDSTIWRDGDFWG